MFEVLIINLLESQDRLDFIQKNLAKYDVPFVRIDAVNVNRDESWRELYNHKRNLQRYHKPLSPGEIGCYMSHYKAWQYIVEHRLHFAIILEDDIRLVDNLEPLIGAIKGLNTPWDYLKLAETSSKRSAFTLDKAGQFDVVKYKKLPIGSAAQAISFKGAQTLIKHFTSIVRPVDVDLQFLAINQLSCFGLKPYIFKPRNLPSTIDSNQSRKGVRGNTFKRLKNNLQFKYQAFMSNKGTDR